MSNLAEVTPRSEMALKFPNDLSAHLGMLRGTIAAGFRHYLELILPQDRDADPADDPAQDSEWCAAF
jgi:hypothetical protein